MDTRMFFISLVVVCLTGTSTATNPGVKARVTKKGIDYANSVAQAALDKELRTLRIPDQGGSEHHFEWQLTSIQNRGVSLPSSAISLDHAHNGLAWTVNNLGINLKADWRVKYKKGWVKISTSGSVDVSVKGVTMAVSIRLGKDGNGRPTLSTATCSAHVGDVDVHFHGGTGFILNLFHSTVEHKVRDLLQGQICKIVTKEVNIDAETRMKKIKVTTEMAHKFLLDYRLTSAPTVSATYLETSHKGEIYWKKDQKEAPFSPKTIPATADVSRMLYIWLTEYTANSYAYAAQSHGYLAYNLTAKDLPAGNRSILNTTCTSGMCVGSLIPQIKKSFPNSLVSMGILSTLAPAMTITTKDAVLNAKGNINMYATTPNKTNVFLLTLNMTVSLTLQGQIKNENLVGQISAHSFKVGIIKSNVGKLNPRALNFILGIAMDTAVIPQLNKLGAKGIALPVSGDISFLNTSLEFLDGALMVATDLKYAGRNDQSLKFVPEGR